MNAPLVLYGAHALAGYKRAGAALAGARAAKRMRMGYTIARHMYRNRGKYYHAAKIIGRTWRRTRRSMVRKPPAIRRAFKSYSVRAPKRPKCVDTTMSNQLNTYTAYQLDVAMPSEGVNPQNRFRNRIYLSGVKLRLEVNNLNTNDALYYNLALVQHRDLPKSEAALGSDRWFRDPSGVALGTAFPRPTCAENHLTPLNTEKFRVFAHYKIKIPSRSTANTGSGDGCRILNKWIPFRKRLLFDLDDATTGHLKWIEWCQQQRSVVSVQTGVCQTFGESILYFRDGT